MVNRTCSTTRKYSNADAPKDYKGRVLPDFENDNLDQRVWMAWLREILTEIKPKLKPTASFMIFIDWRQIAALSDVLALAQYRQKGIAVWNKINSRPYPNGFSQICEFILWGNFQKVLANGQKMNATYNKGIFNVLNPANRGKNSRYHFKAVITYKVKAVRPAGSKPRKHKKSRHSSVKALK